MRSILLLLFAVFISCVMLSGCSSTPNPCPCNAPLKIAKDKYNFVMYDSTGVNKIAEGDFNIESADTTHFSGTYKFRIIFKDDFPGQSSMNGDFTGQINYKDRKASVNTNPRIADSNVFFSLYMDTDSMFGDWSYSTFRGPRASGKVTISKPFIK